MHARRTHLALGLHSAAPERRHLVAQSPARLLGVRQLHGQGGGGRVRGALQPLHVPLPGLHKRLQLADAPAGLQGEGRYASDISLGPIMQGDGQRRRRQQQSSTE